MKQRSSLVCVRARDLEPGRRVRVPRSRGRDLTIVIDVTQDEHGTCLVNTEEGVYPCDKNTLFDAEDETASVRGVQ